MTTDIYKALVSAFTKSLTAPKEQADQHIKEALILSVAFDQETVEAAKREAAVMAVIDRTMLA